MSWRTTKYEDLHRIVLKNDPSDIDMRSMTADTEQIREMLRLNAHTWNENGSILAIVGVASMWKGVGTVWMLISEDARRRGLSLTRGILRFLAVSKSERGYWRLQATIAHGDERARRWIIHLGFVYEGTMVAYAPDGKTHDLYARVRG